MLSLKEFKVLKFGRVLQSIFYLLGYERDVICLPKTNKFHWKRAKDFVNDDFIESLNNYEILGPKTDPYLGYQTINFIENNI